MLRIEHLKIESINGIKELVLNFNPGLNIITGPNGIGKTTIIKCLRESFSKRNIRGINVSVGSRVGMWEVVVDNNYSTDFKLFEIYADEMMEYYHPNRRTKYLNSNELIYFDVNNRSTVSNQGIQLRSLKEWFYKNYYYNSISEEKYYNHDLIKKCFYHIDPEVSFSRIVLKDDLKLRYKNSLNNKLNSQIEIMVNTPLGEIPLQSLSSGYLSSLMMLLGIIKNVENKKIEFIQDFNGVLLIDEIDLHLHPEWQRKLLRIIKWLLPRAQIIATTHSPHIIQEAGADEIIPLEQDEYIRNPYVRKNPINSEYGYLGWTIEEILTDVMGLESTISKKLRYHLEKFENYRDKDNVQGMKETYTILQKMIHPNNPLLKILSIQSGEVSIWGEPKYDTTN
ncbi:AAA family ATPase [Bacillus sp. 1P06AnD]|uniref:AAA family ATPase n=1 Tax=Bacillus sp. 1P06AnD TaxID=3132208 RepID=UPI0039A1FC97